MPSINKKVIWITDASSAIGEGLAYALAAKNCKLNNGGISQRSLLAERVSKLTKN